ncbi:MAG: hypothetical protein ACTS2F_02065 [Thainema sp.]
MQNYATLPGVVEIAILSPNRETLARSPFAVGDESFVRDYPNLIPVLETAACTGVATNFQTTVGGTPVLVDILPFSSILFGAGQRGLAIAIVDLHQMQQEAQSTFLASTVTMLGGQPSFWGSWRCWCSTTFWNPCASSPKP